jgi:deoxyribonuclease V
MLPFIPQVIHHGQCQPLRERVLSDYNQAMQASRRHPWQVTPAEAQAIQRSLADQVSRKNEVGLVRLVAGVDISSDRASRMATGAAVVLAYPDMTVVERSVVEQEVDFPYIPGLLSFREAPLILAACEKLNHIPDLILVDGQGIAHPRRLGLASHVGLLLDLPAIGCAKSLLCGSHGLVGDEAGSLAEISHDGEVIGAALRTKKGVRPLYVSVGHKVDLASAVSWVMRCCRGYRMPEPTRMAHLTAGAGLSSSSPAKREKQPVGPV